MQKKQKNSKAFILMVILVLLIASVSLAASEPASSVDSGINGFQKEGAIEVEKWSGLEMGFFCFYQSEFESDISTLNSNGFSQLRVDIPDYQNSWLDTSKSTVEQVIDNGFKVIWGVSSNSFNNAAHTITSSNWPTFRQAILDAAQWAQDNGVYEFQLGNEEEYHIDGTTMTVDQIIANLKSVASEVQAIYTIGNISYSCAHSYISNWTAAGKGDIDILASNVYMGYDGNYSDSWKGEINNLISAFGIDGTYLTEFGLSATSLADYSTNETVQAEALSEMIEYIKNSGMERAFYFAWRTDGFGVMKPDGTYRQLWDVLTASDNAILKDSVEDTIAPTISTFLINGGDASTQAREVTLTIEASDETTSSESLMMRFKKEDRSWSSWKPYTTSKLFITLSKGVGVKTVHIQVKDEKKNKSESSATIEFKP